MQKSLHIVNLHVTLRSARKAKNNEEKKKDEKWSENVMVQGFVLISVREQMS